MDSTNVNCIEIIERYYSMNKCIACCAKIHLKDRQGYVSSGEHAFEYVHRAYRVAVVHEGLTRNGDLKTPD